MSRARLVWFALATLVASACGSPESGADRDFTPPPDLGEDAGTKPKKDAEPPAKDAGGKTDGATPPADAGDLCKGVVCHALATCDAATGKCTCAPGYTGDGTECKDLDECKTGTDACSDDGICTNVEGGFGCKCKPGHVGDGFTCTDFDECAEGIATCHPDATCTNVPDTYECKCGTGFSGDGKSCDDIDECKKKNDCDDAPGTTCKNKRGGYDCECSEGFIFHDGACKTLCEITAIEDACDTNAVCIEGTGGCACNPGYLGDGQTCTKNALCDVCKDNSVCAVTPSVTCTCLDGFTGDGMVGCTDIDECATDADDCAADATCLDADGGYTCTCKSGFSGDGKTCTNIDECATSVDDCDPLATCDDTDGSFTCTCNDGYSGSGKSCTNIDECATGDDDCDTNADCTDTLGNFNCACKTGFSGDGKTCTDYDECAGENGGNDCAVKATCTNTPGSFTCACNAGYGGNGKICTDIDECANGTHSCGDVTLCTNTEGSFTCSSACPITGTWAVLQRTCSIWGDLEDNLPFPYGWTVIIQGGNFAADVWAIRKLTYDGTTLTTQYKPCGGLFPDVKAGSGVPTYGGETYGLHTLADSTVPGADLAYWDSLPFLATYTDTDGEAAITGAGLAAPTVATTKLASLSAGSPIELVRRGYIFGGKMNSPRELGVWPSSRTAVKAESSCGSLAAGEMCWKDDDADGNVASTIASKPKTAGSYDYAPNASGLTVNRIGCQFQAGRSINSEKGVIVDCNHMKGTLEDIRLDTRLNTCKHVSPANCETGLGSPACPQTIDCHTGAGLSSSACLNPSSLDSQVDGTCPQVKWSTNVAVRVDDNTTCAQIRSGTMKWQGVTATFPTAPSEPACSSYAKPATRRTSDACVKPGD